MEPFYGSDEEVAWGPVTLKEIKRDFTKPLFRKPNKRHTTHCEVTSEMPNISEDTIPDISEYITASEAASEKNDTQFYSTVENSNLNRSVFKDLQDLSLNHEDVETSHLNFVQNAMGKPDMFIRNEHLTLVQSPTNNSKYYDTFDTIEISSDEENEQSVKKENLSCVLEMSDNNTSDYSEKDCSKQEEFCEIESYCKDNDLSAISESKCPPSPDIIVPEIDLQQFNDSNLFSLNDTIEKINAILNQAGDISFTENESTDNIKATDNTEFNTNDREVDANVENISANENCCHSVNLISGSFIQKPILDLPSKHNSTKYYTPTKTNMPVKSNIPILKKSPDQFKVPIMPAHKTKSNLKDIVSPVRMYIKYSPKPVLKRNVNSVEMKKIQKPSSSKNKENIDTIPSKIIYKPSKNPILGSERNICLPASLEKMVVKSTVTKHERNPVSVSLYKKDISLNQECDLTKGFLNDTQLSECDQNMSVLHKTPAFRK